MENPTLLTENIWLDTETDVVVVSFDRVSVAFPVEEFLSFCDEIFDARDSLLKNDNYIISEIVDGDNATRMLSRKHSVEDDEYDN
ncbi:hypothetical protein CMI47_19015 [Candidatus Pacearchaeota archaeon]|nr:hypothetical protein [Candidatus Pacearchaeota archaeon]